MPSRLGWQLTKRCIDYPDYHFVIAPGVLGNTRNRCDNANVRQRGYEPQNDVRRYTVRIAATGQVGDGREALFRGGFG